MAFFIFLNGILKSQAMHRIFIFIIGIFLLSISSKAEKINKEEAVSVAKNFFYERLSDRSAVSFDHMEVENMLIRYVDGEEVLFIANFKTGGWVIVTAHQSAPPVLAYSYNGKFSDLDLPPQLQSYLKSYTDQILYNAANTIYSDRFLEDWQYYLNTKPDDLERHQGRSIAPLLTSTWDQGGYYNEMCPEDPAGPGGHCYAGCVATAMGQVMNYFRFPQSGTGSYSYSCPPYGMLSADFENTTYRWNEMPLYLNGSNPAVAELLYHLGVSVDMVYGPDGSGMYNHKAAYSLRTYFKYSPQTQYVYRDSTNMDWDSLIIDHLDRKIPMYYAGWSVPNVYGHAFVCDGYEDPGYYHFNWGWSGSYDGYFYTDNLSPGGSNFNNAQELIINCFPDTVNHDYPEYPAGPDTLLSTNGTVDDGSGPVYDYPNGFYYKWLISPEDSVEFITIDFLRFATGTNDILTIYDGADTLSPILGTFSGDEIPESIVSGGDKLLLTFLTDNNDTDKGFLLSYFSEIPTYCSQMTNMVSVQDTISDGSGPRDYHNNTTCIWNIHPENAGKITLYFNHFSTEAENDVLKIYDGQSLLAILSGDTMPEPISVYSGTLFMTFSTNATVTAPGWEAWYITELTGNPEYETIPVEIYPNPASNRLIVSPGVKSNVYILEIHSMDGKLLYKKQEVCGTLQLDTSRWMEGMYMVSIRNRDQVSHKKILINR